jgi:hypothetical protein
MAVNLSPVGGVAVQFFDNAGNVLTGGKLYTYAAGTTTPQTTYTTSAGNIAWSNPIILDAAGRVSGSGEIWLADAVQYKFILRDSNDVLIATYDNITGINSNFVNFTNQQEIQTATAGQTVFNLTTTTYSPGTNSLSVFVDGVNQYGPGAQYAYLETDSDTVTFVNGLHVGALVKFTTSQLNSSSGQTAAQTSFTGFKGQTGNVQNLADNDGSDWIGFEPAGTSAVARSAQDKMRETVSVMDFGADPTGTLDSRDAFNAAIQTEGTVYVPQGTYIINSAITITNPVKLIGDGTQKTNIHRNYSPGTSTANDAEGIFNIRDGGSGVILQDMTLRSLAGQSGGCLVSLINTTANFGLFKFDQVNFTTTGTSTHQYTIYADGTAVTTAPIGIRGLDMIACTVFGGGISTLLIKGVLKFSFLGGGVFTAGGAAGSNVRFDGSAAVPTQSFQFLPADCSCPISFDYAKLGIFGCGIMGAVTNTSNTENVYGFGFTGSLQQNWGNSAFFDTSTGLKMTANQKISNKGGTANFALEMLGNITGFSKAGTVTTIGQTGVALSTTCPNTQTFGFANQSSKMFTISTGGGAATLVFADYKATTITLVVDPSSEFQASSTPGAGFTGIFKSANSHQINIKNNTGSAVTYSILNVGAVTGTTDPA